MSAPTDDGAEEIIAAFFYSVPAACGGVDLGVVLVCRDLTLYVVLAGMPKALTSIKQVCLPYGGVWDAAASGAGGSVLWADMSIQRILRYDRMGPESVEPLMMRFARLAEFKRRPSFEGLGEEGRGKSEEGGVQSRLTALVQCGSSAAGAASSRDAGDAGAAGTAGAAWTAGSAGESGEARERAVCMPVGRMKVYGEWDTVVFNGKSFTLSPEMKKVYQAMHELGAISAGTAKTKTEILWRAKVTRIEKRSLKNVLCPSGNKICSNKELYVACVSKVVERPPRYYLTQ